MNSRRLARVSRRWGLSGSVAGIFAALAFGEATE